MDERESRKKQQQQQQGTSSSREQQAAAASSSWSYSYSSCSFTWPPRSYPCSFCKREFRSAQALGGHMNVHRRDRARLRHGSPPPASLLPPRAPPPPARAPPPAMTMMMIPNLNYPPPHDQYHHHRPSSSSKKLPLDRDSDSKRPSSMELELGVGPVVCSNNCCNSAAATSTTTPADDGAPEDDLDLELRLGVPSSSFHRHTHVDGRVHDM